MCSTRHLDNLLFSTAFYSKVKVNNIKITRPVAVYGIVGFDVKVCNPLFMEEGNTTLNELMTQVYRFTIELIIEQM